MGQDIRKLFVAVLLTACNRDPSPTPASGEAATVEPPKFHAGDAQFAPGPCTRIGSHPWRCHDSANPIDGRTDVLLAKASGSELCVLYTDHRLQCYEKGQPTHVYENIDDFEFRRHLSVASKGRLGHTTYDNPAGLEFDEVEIQGEIVEIGSECNRTRDGLLDCGDAKVPGVSSFCEGNQYFCALAGEQVICGGEEWLDLGHNDWKKTPAPIAGLPPAVQLDCASNGACALTRDGEVWCWGDDQSGTFGRQFWEEASATPKPIPDLRGALGFDLASGHGCAVLIDDALVCWGNVPEGLPQLKKPDEHRCLERSLADWKAELEAAQGSAATSKLLYEVGFSSKWYTWNKDSVSATLDLEHVTVHDVELDGTAPSERVVVVRLRANNGTRIAVLAMRPNEAGQWCPLDESLSSEHDDERQPMEEWPARPDFVRPQTLSFVELTAPGRMAVEVINSAGDHGPYEDIDLGGGEVLTYWEDSDYVLNYYELRDGTFVDIFQLPLYHSRTDEKAKLTQTGTVNLVGEFPKTLETTLTTKCYRGRCKDKTENQTWTFDGERYK